MLPPRSGSVLAIEPIHTFCFFLFIKEVTGMDIPALSIAMSQSQVMTQASAAVLAMTLDTVEQQGAGLMELMQVPAQEMELSVHPNLGANIDISI